MFMLFGGPEPDVLRACWVLGSTRKSNLESIEFHIETAWGPVLLNIYQISSDFKNCFSSYWWIYNPATQGKHHWMFAYLRLIKALSIVLFHPNPGASATPPFLSLDWITEKLFMCLEKNRNSFLFFSWFHHRKTRQWSAWNCQQIRRKTSRSNEISLSRVGRLKRATKLL